MKNNICKYLISVLAVGLITSVTSCNKILDIEPESSITPEQYFNSDTQLESYLLNFYDWLPTHPTDGGGGYGFYAVDNNTDNQTTPNVQSKYLKGTLKVANDGTSYSFSQIYKVNYFLDIVLPKWKAGKITGSTAKINHCIGEAYFFRAFAYYEKYVKFGDYPIVRTTLTNKLESLVEASKRSPRNEVARFILSDLDSAAMLLSVNSPDGRNNKLSSPVAKLLKSRVALFEASWLENFKGTAFVPNGSEWPGATKEFTKDYQFSSGSIDSEIDFFLDAALEASGDVAEDFMPVMSKNTQVVPEPGNENNPYYWMFCDTDMSKYPEVMLWREYNSGIKIAHAVNTTASTTSAPLTRGMIKQFLDINGMPWYAPNALWVNDDEKYEVRENRDSRAQLFIKEPGQDLMWYNLNGGESTYGNNVEPWAPVKADEFQITGYAARKGMNPDRNLNMPLLSTTGSPVYRSAEALLNYIEASYMKDGSISSKAREYWEYLRQRAGIKANTIDATIAAIDMTKEALYDWGAYSAGKLVDATTMAIRKERRSEYICEGRRMEDLLRWRALDQLIETPYHIEGMRLWNSKFYSEKLTEKEREDYYISGIDNAKATVSEPTDLTGTGDENGNNKGDYIKIHRVSSKNTGFAGTSWTFAHYLSPIEIEHFLITSEDGTAENSTLYQNPYWPLVGNNPAIK